MENRKNAAKLNFEIAKEIRKEYKESYTTYEKLAIKYKVSYGSILKIIHNKTYFDLNEYRRSDVK